jgi:hypothetical protein
VNIKQLKKNLHHRVRLRPVPLSKDADGRAVNADDHWILASLVNERVELSNVRTGHVIGLNPDHVHSYTSDVVPHGSVPAGFLELKVQVTLSGACATVEPILSGAARLPTFRVSDRPPRPDEGKDGDVWFEVDSDQSRR